MTMKRSAHTRVNPSTKHLTVARAADAAKLKRRVGLKVNAPLSAHNLADREVAPVLTERRGGERLSASRLIAVPYIAFCL